MRIIAGTARSLPLKAPDGMDTRPTTDRIKETLFNIIQDEVPGAYFLDLFAGSGQMGLEAVSRGARYAVFVDNGKKPTACIEENIRFTKFEHQTKLYPTEVLSALRAMEGKYQLIMPEITQDLSGNKMLGKDRKMQITVTAEVDRYNQGGIANKVQQYKTLVQEYME